jgi:hypothetical protein
MKKGQIDPDSKLTMARDILLANPTITQNRTLAKMLLQKYPLLFKDIETARTAIRNVQGKTGNKFKTRMNVTITTFTEHLSKLREQHKVNEGMKIDTSPYKINKTFKKVLVISDLHIPFCDLKALDLALEYGYKANVDAVIINGDLLDFTSVSRFLSRPNEMRMLDNVEEGKKMLRYIKDALGCKVIFHEGNHSVRVEHYLISKAPEFWGLPSVELKNLLGCDEMGIDHVSNIRTMHLGKLTIAHGNHIVRGIFAPVNPARGVFIKSNASVLISHVHRSSEHIETDIKGKVTGCWSIGCLTTTQPEFNPMVSKHNMGFAIVEIESSQGDFVVDNRKIIEYKVR